ncbi:MAG: hypothetical protein ACRDK3_05695 [Actinomycetota bacterium]
MFADVYLLIESLVEQVLDGPVILGATLVASLFFGPSLVQALVRRTHHH